MTAIPENILKRMSPADRAKLGKAGRTMSEAFAVSEARSEKELQTQVAQWLSLRGYWFARSRMDKRTGNTLGCPDFLVAVNGRFVAIECKSATGKLSADQEAARESLQKNGAVYILARKLTDVTEGVK
jgi:hypothetical protein